ncbi:sigma-70 family RNA polymerase sigma factor [Spirosoma sp. 48-14]|uniref:RNA polymerase sigma factor n=1 Tax=Spirosoma sp. 48-14 TaxID=1895854 RepID=UPI0009641DFC|nr:MULTISPECIES: sigma-70 family RNA polymerase sigma factor [unclassified Spirosoma]MBN8826602.1 sigma-70 family RNA polymerase sigma factor [Spirosoma sp.]OJW72826.1 MAG: RNA polymerase subunit sigma-70 [Spirosoma sp. 48-14]
MLFKKNPRFSEDDLASVLMACRAGDNRAQRTLISQFLSFAKRVCQRYTANPHETEEIINEGFLKVFTHLERYDSTQPFQAWLRTILVNTAVDYYRKRQKWTNQLGLDELEVIDWNDDVIAAISGEEILAMVQQLPPAYRMVFTLFVVEGYSHREIADLLGIQEGTSKSNLRDARRKLQHMVKLYYPALYQQYTWPKNRFNEN